MDASINGAADVALVANLWGPRLVRFYFYFCGNQPLAESSAIETLTEVMRPRPLFVSSGAIVRLAILRCSTLTRNRANVDRIAQALASLPPRQRVAVALVRGMGIGIEELAEATDTDVSELKRLHADGLLELCRLLVKDQDLKLENTSES